MHGVNINAEWFILVGILVVVISLLCFLLADKFVCLRGNALEETQASGLAVGQ